MESTSAEAGTASSPIGAKSSSWRLRRLEEDRFVSEALAYEVIGRFEHKGTPAVRLESGRRATRPAS